MPLPAILFSTSEAPEQRYSKRRTLKLLVDSKTDGGAGDKALLHDISAGGFLVESTAALDVGDRLELDLPEEGSIGAVVVWSSGHLLGCRFERRISAAAVSATLLRASPVTETYDLLAQWEALKGSERNDGPSPRGAVAAAAANESKLSPALRLGIILFLSLALWLLIFRAAGVV